MSKDWTQVAHAPKWSMSKRTGQKAYWCARCNFATIAANEKRATAAHAKDIADRLQAIADAAVARLSGEGGGA